MAVRRSATRQATAETIAQDATRRPNKPGRPTRAELKAASRKVRERFLRARNAEKGYARHLRKIAAHVGAVVGAYAERGWVWTKLAELTASLEKYAEIIEPWARAVASRMLAEVARRDARAWREAAGTVGRSIRAEVESAPTGATTRALLEDQVTLIKSLPIEAAQRVHRLALEAVHTGGRADAIAREIMRTGHVTRSRADLIARTETSRAQTSFTMARALHLGSEGYFWETARDANVRDSHKAMQGKFIRWSQAPTLDNLTGHAGALPNCRCWCRVDFGPE